MLLVDADRALETAHETAVSLPVISGNALAVLVHILADDLFVYGETAAARETARTAVDELRQAANASQSA